MSRYCQETVYDRGARAKRKSGCYDEQNAKQSLPGSAVLLYEMEGLSTTSIACAAARSIMATKHCHEVLGGTNSLVANECLAEFVFARGSQDYQQVSALGVGYLGTALSSRSAGLADSAERIQGFLGDVR